MGDHLYASYLIFPLCICHLIELRNFRTYIRVLQNGDCLEAGWWLKVMLSTLFILFEEKSDN